LGDAYIFKLYVLSQDRNLEWFPRLRAKSLAADEGEGEQVEFRSLQSQLETTQVLVKCLSQQLMELRDQVRLMSNHKCSLNRLTNNISRNVQYAYECSSNIYLSFTDDGATKAETAARSVEFCICNLT